MSYNMKCICFIIASFGLAVCVACGSATDTQPRTGSTLPNRQQVAGDSPVHDTDVSTPEAERSAVHESNATDTKRQAARGALPLMTVQTGHIEDVYTISFHRTGVISPPGDVIEPSSFGK